MPLISIKIGRKELTTAPEARVEHKEVSAELSELLIVEVDRLNASLQ